MIGYRLTQLLTDIGSILGQGAESENDARLESSSDPDGQAPPLGQDEKAKTFPIYKIVAQIALTLMIIVLCLYISVNSSDEIARKLAFAGFGVVFGYWLG